VRGEVTDAPIEPPVVDPLPLADPADVQGRETGMTADTSEESPYIRFGERILVRRLDDGTTVVTKPYSLPAGRASKLIQLMSALEPFPFGARARPGPEGGEVPPFDPNRVEYEVLEKWDEEYYANFALITKAATEPVPTPQPTTISDVLVVTATVPLLGQFEDFLDLFAAAGVPQIELEAKIIEVVETDSLDVGVDADLAFGSANFVKSFGFSLPNTAQSAEALLTLGAVQDSVAFDGILEAVARWQNVSIDSRPRTVVRAGGIARIDSATEIPYADIKTLSADSNFTAATSYKRIGVQLLISPRVIGTRTIALDVFLEGSQTVGTQATLSTGGGDEIVVPIIAYRSAKTLVYLEPGQTLVIGGLTQEREQEIVSRVPILGDLPILGLLFRSTFKVMERQHVLFAISPRILQRSDFAEDL
jgi:type II secretory pathway component GspD/PulD (secretin)